jgi:hypothetical protein
MILTVMKIPELSHVVLFAAGIEPENTASVRCMLCGNPSP